MKLDQLRKTALKMCKLSPDLPIVVGVSGGPDSYCLLDALVQLGFRVTAAHFDHQLRADSARDAEHVSATAARMGASFVLGSADVSAFARQEHRSIEDAARILRYRFLFEQARAVAAQAVAVGHTADDQVETLLIHLLRGAGLNGLKGMAFRALLPAWDSSIPLVRPLLEFWREDTLSWCSENGLEPLYDPTNQDPAYLRNRVRHELVPLLEQLNPRVRQSLWRTSQVLAGEASILEEAVTAAWDACMAEQQPCAAALRRSAFTQLSLGLQRAVLRKTIAQLNPQLDNVDFAAVERALDWINSSEVPSSGQVDLVGDLRVLTEGERLWVTGSAALLPDADWPQLDEAQHGLPVPGVLEFGGWRLESAWVEQGAWPAFAANLHLPWEAWLDADQVIATLAVRRAHPGERIQPLGIHGHSQKLSDFWVNEKLPRRARAAWPVVVSGEAVIWLPGFRPAHPWRITEGTRRALHLRLFRKG